MMRKGAWRRNALRGACAAIALALAPAAAARVVSTNVAFMGVNLNPWDNGLEFVVGDENRDIATNFSLPTINANTTPQDAVADLLGLPGLSFAKLGFSASGYAGLALGYHVNGGRMNISFPGQALMDFETAPGDVVQAGKAVAISTNFLSGLTRPIKLADPMMAQLVAGPGYAAQHSIDNFDFGTYSTPNFQTAFPNAMAYARFDYDVTGSTQVSGGLNTPLGCLCYTVPFSHRVAGAVDIARVDKNGVNLAGLGRWQPFDVPYAVPGGAITLSYPDVAVGGVVGGDGITMTGSGIKPIVSFNASMEQLVPVLGQFLHQAIGPFDVTMLSVNGGPVLSLYQDITVRMMPQFTISFNQTVGIIRNGVTSFAKQISGVLGDNLQWFPIVQTSDTVIRAQTSFRPTVEINNQTGLALGYNLDVRTMGVGTPLGQLGPYQVASLNDPAAYKMPAMCCDAFTQRMPWLWGSVETFHVQGYNPQLQQALSPPISISAINVLGAGQYQLTFVVPPSFATPGFNTPITALLTGVLQRAEHDESAPYSDGGPRPDTALIADSDVTVMIPFRDPLSDTGYRMVPINLGRYFCFSCTVTESLFNTESPVLSDGTDGIFVPRIDTFRTDTPDLSLDPVFSTPPASIKLADVVYQGPRQFLPVPEPSSWAMMVAGFGLVGAALRRRVTRVTVSA